MIVADNDFKNYQIDNKDSKAFLFSPGGRWCQSFLIVWVPGYLNVIGDMGDLIIRVAALEDFLTGMYWLYNHANPGSLYFMEKVLNHKRIFFDPEATKQNLIEVFDEMTAEDVQEYAENYLTYDFLDKLFNYRLASNLTKIPVNDDDEKLITGEDIVNRLKECDITEDDAVEIVDWEQRAYTYDWNFLNCRIEAIKEFAKKQLENAGILLDE